jgi:hypothetical protein
MMNKVRIRRGGEDPIQEDQIKKGELREKLMKDHHLVRRKIITQ